jgi:hypothetical protein
MKSATKSALVAPAQALTRDAWLTQFIEMARPLFAHAGQPLPPIVRAAICPPHRAKQRYIGLCWSDAVSEDNGREIWITAAETDPVKVAGIMVHELAHAALPHSEKHGKRFGKLARALGLEGPLRATTEGAVFRMLWADVLARLGPLPAARFVAGAAVDFRKQKTPKMTNVACPHCGFVAKVKVDQLTWGRLTCPVHPEEQLLMPKERS